MRVGERETGACREEGLSTDRQQEEGLKSGRRTRRQTARWCRCAGEEEGVAAKWEKGNLRREAAMEERRGC